MPRTMQTSRVKEGVHQSIQVQVGLPSTQGMQMMVFLETRLLQVLRQGKANSFPRKSSWGSGCSTQKPDP